MAAIRRVDVMKGVNPVAEKRKAKAVAAKDWRHSKSSIPSTSKATGGPACAPGGAQVGSARVENTS